MSLGGDQGPIIGGPLGSPEPIEPGKQSTRRSGGGALPAIVVLLVAAAGVGGWFVASVLSDEVDDRTRTTSERVTTTEPSGRTGPTGDAAEPVPEEPAPSPEPGRPADYLRRDTTDEVLVDLARAIGTGYSAVRIVVYDEYVIAEAQDPAVPSHVDRYVWRDGQVSGPDPTPAPDPLDATLWSPDQVLWDRVPALTRDALERFDLPEEEVTHVIVDRFLPFDERIIIRVYVSEPGRGGGGYVQYTRIGEFVEVVG